MNFKLRAFRRRFIDPIFNKMGYERYGMGLLTIPMPRSETYTKLVLTSYHDTSLLFLRQLSQEAIIYNEAKARDELQQQIFEQLKPLITFKKYALLEKPYERTKASLEIFVKD